MGYNTTVLVLNDCLDAIANDPNFGKNLAAAIMKVGTYNISIDVPAKSKNIYYSAAASVIETHHADHDIYVKVGGNYAEVVKDIQA